MYVKLGIINLEIDTCLEVN